MIKLIFVRCLFIVVGIAFASCGARQKESKSPGNEGSTSEQFLEGIRGYSRDASVSGDQLVVDGDSISFPQELTLGRVYVFYGKQNQVGYQLQLTRLDLTTIKYSFAGISNGKVLLKDTDTAGLQPLFFLGSEVLEDGAGNGYPANAYSANKADSCTVEIKIAEGNTGAEVFATVAISGCEQLPEVHTPLLRAVR